LYKEKIIYFGPIYKFFKKEGDKIKNSFRYAGRGLYEKANEKLNGFGIAGADKIFHWAHAKIRS
jgi:sialate O-acetylesterase